MQATGQNPVTSPADLDIEPGEMEIRIVIADDEPLARQLLSRLVRGQPGLMVVGVADDGESALRNIRETRPDLVFLDIRMPRLDGLELAAELAALEPQPYVIFVTAFDEYATDAFDLEALDYLVKPIAKDRFLRSIQRARRAICARQVQDLGERIAAVAATEPAGRGEAGEDPYVVVRQREELIRIREDDIYWLEAASQYVNVHTRDARYIVAEPLARYHARLRSEDFVRVHRSAVVNIGKIRRILKRQNGLHELQLDNGTGVPLSRSRRMLVRDLLGACAENRRHA